MIKLAILDSNILSRESLSALLNKNEEIEISIEAKSGTELLQLLEKHPTDVIIMDIQLSEMDGYETCTKIRSKYPHIKILVLSDLISKETIQNLKQRGVRGFFSKGTDPKELEQAILNSNDNSFILEKKLNDQLIQSYLTIDNTKSTDNPPITTISSREVSVIKLICKQQTTTQIADQLCLAPATVSTYRQRVLEKTNCTNFIGVIIFMLKNNLLLIEDF